MIARTPRFWFVVLILATVVVVQSLRTWRWTSHATNAILDRDTVQGVTSQSKPAVRAQHVSAAQIISQSDNIRNSTLGFQKIFAINLPSRTDKHDGLLLASKLTGFDIEFMHGVDPLTIPRKSLPQKYTGKTQLPPGIVGCWRAHMNFLARVVQEDLATALVLEDDVDWDVRLPKQLQEFRAMSNAVVNRARDVPVKMKFESLHLNNFHTTAPTSPYGDGWDILLLGNCGVDIDLEKPHVIRARDETVPDLHWLKIYGDPNGARLNPHPSRARLVGSALDQTCTYAYAVTQFAARRLLLDLGLERLDKPFDLMLRDWCEGKFPQQGPPRRCIGVLPSLFESYRREGMMEGDSDIDLDRYGQGNRDKASTVNIRKSVRMNLGNLLDGKTTEQMEDQFPNFRFGGTAEFPARIDTAPEGHPALKKG